MSDEMNQDQEQNQGQDNQNKTPTHTWKDALKPELRASDYLAGITNPNDAISDYIQLKDKMVNAPKPPESPDKYQLELPEDAGINEDFVNGFKSTVHELGLDNDKANKLATWYSNYANQLKEAQQKQIEQAEKQAEETLRSEWQGDDFDKNKNEAVEAFKKFAGDDDEVKEMLENVMFKGVRLGNHPKFLKLFHEIAKQTKDDSAIMRDEQGNPIISEEEQAARMFPSMRRDS